MKRFKIIVFSVVISTIAFAQDMALTTKQQALVAIAANEAKGNIKELKSALNEGLE